MNDRLTILGGAGFVGSSLAIALKSANPACDVICFDNLRRRGSELNLPRLKELGIRFLHGDIRSVDDLGAILLQQPKTIIDCSAEPSVLAGISSPRYVLETNLLGTINVLELARKLKAQFLFLSTSRVYSIPALRRLRLVEQATRFGLAPEQSEPGASQAGVSENFPTTEFRSLYGTTKFASEMLIQEYREAFGLKAIVNRCGVLTGPWQMGKVDQGVFVLWMAAHYFRRTLEYIGFGGSGKQVRDLLHIEDLIALVIMQLGQFDSWDGEVFNVGGGVDCSLSLLETTTLCQQLTGNKVEIRQTAQERPADVPLFIVDNRKVTERTGWCPSQTARSTLEDIYRWIIENEDQLRPILS